MPLRHMRYTRNAVTALSLLLCVASLAAWYVTADLPPVRPWVLPVAPGAVWEVKSGGGKFVLGRTVRLPARLVPLEPQVFDGAGSTFLGIPFAFVIIIVRVDDSRVQVPVVTAVMRSVRTHYRGWAVEGRWWFAAFVFAALPGRPALRAAVRWRRRRLGLCEECTYDLRESSTQCPECGTPRRRALGAS